MRKTIVTAALAGTIAVTGAAFAVPALADTTPTTVAAATATTDPAPSQEAEDARPSPQARFTEALSGLVTDGTITAEQADAVATTLAEQMPKGGPGGHGGPGGIGAGEIAAADALGISEDDLRAELADGKSVADVAEERGVDLDTVVTAITEAAQARIAQAVEDGGLTQERADALTEDLGERVTEEVSEVHDGERGGRGGPGGGGRGGSGPTGSDGAPTS